MKRWNGWGNLKTDYPVPPSAQAYLVSLFGKIEQQPDAVLEEILKSVPASRLPAHALIDVSAEVRVTHARGQSMPDWVALRSGQIGTFPDGVAVPRNEEDVTALMNYAKTVGARVIPYGGGTSVVGHINPIASDTPVLTLSMERMTRLLDIDEFGLTATFETGVTGPELEQALNGRGFTLGHFPQSHEYSTLGGWIATRSSGQQSYKYGRIEPLFAGGRVQTPRGLIEIPHFPASAAGPDIKEMILGSEGRMGVITLAKVRVRRLPEAEDFYGVFFPSWEQGTAAVRQIAQEEISVSMLRTLQPAGNRDHLDPFRKILDQLGRQGLAFDWLRRRTLLTGFRCLRDCRASQACKGENCLHLPSAWWAFCRDNCRSHVGKKPFLLSLPAQHALGSGSCD